MGVLIIVAAGLVGTTAMIMVMAFIHRMKWANADMIRAIGSLITRSSEMSFFYGLVIHYSIGLSFAFAYGLLIGAGPIVSGQSAFVVASLTGLVHGLIVGLMLEIAVAEHHPLLKYRSVGMAVVLAHVVGHIVYGLTMGLVIALNWSKVFSTLEDMAQGEVVGDFIGFTFIWLPLFGPPFLFTSYLIYMAFSAQNHLEKRRIKRKVKVGKRSRLAA